MKIFSLLSLSLLLLIASAPMYGQEMAAEHMTISEQLREMVIDGSKQMYSIASSVKTVKDAEAAKPKVQRMMSDMIQLFGKLTTQLRTISLKEMFDLRTMGRILEDPELVEWREKAEGALFKLEENDPEAAAVMWEAGSEYDTKLMETMMNLIVGFDELAFNDMGEPLYTQSQLIVEYKEGLLEHCENMAEIMEDIKSVKGANKARKEIAAEAEKLEAILWGILEKADRLSSDEKKTLGKAMQKVLADEEVISCSQDAVEEHEDLLKRSPKGGERFDEINKEESKNFEELSRELVEFLVELGESQE